MSQEVEQMMDALSAPFPASSIHFRVGAMTKQQDKAIALAYIDSRDAMKRLDDVVGPMNWQRRYPWSDDKRLYCEVGIRHDGEWIWKGDGAGLTQVEAEKGAFSDAFKRACVNWGIGQYLYDCPNDWWPIQNKRFSPETDQAIRKRFHAWQCEYFAPVIHKATIAAVKEAIARWTAGEAEALSDAAEAWFELSSRQQESLWKAPTKGGAFTTKEREIMKSSEFRKAYYGEEAA